MTTITQQPRATLPAGFVWLPVELFYRLALPRVRLYATVDQRPEPVLLTSDSRKLVETPREDLPGNDRQRLLVARQDLDPSDKNWLTACRAFASDTKLPAVLRMLAIQTIYGAEFERCWRSKSTSRLVDCACETGPLIARVVTRACVSAHELFANIAHDMSPACHAMNVAAYGMLLAEHLGVSSFAEKSQIATGALLHDLGKRSSAKPGDHHTTLGYIELCRNDKLSRGGLMMIYQHHEWVNGAGEPVAILGDEIHPWAKLLAVVNQFDSLTADDGGRRGLDPVDAIGTLAKRANKQFDLEVLRCWISIF